MKKLSTKLLLIIFGIFFLSCTSSKQVTYKQALALQGDRNYLTIISGKKKFTLVNYKFSDTGLEGTLIKYKKSKGYPIQVYAELDYIQELDKNLNRFVKINNSSIQGIVIKKRDPKKTSNSFLEFFAHIFHLLV